MKFLFISYDGLTDPLGQSQIIPYIVGLKQKGLDYSILSAEKKDAFVAEKELIQEQLSSHSISWSTISYTKKPAFLSTLYDVIRIRSEAKKEIIKNGITHLHCRSYVSMYAAFPLIKKFNLKVIFDMRGFWIDERIEGGIWNKSNPMIALLVRYLKGKEKKWFEESQRIISLTKNGKSAITSLYPFIDESKISVIPCCADETLFYPAVLNSEDKTSLRQQLGLRKEERILAYLGSIGTWYLSSEMMQSFKYLRENRVVDKFLILTRENAQRVEYLADQNGVDKKDLLINSASRNEVPKLLSIIDLGIFYIKPSFSKIASSPTKLGELLLMGKPVICNKGVGDLDTFFTKNSVGLCLDLNEIKSLNLVDCQDIMSFNEVDIREAGIKEFGLKNGIEKYYQAIRSLT